VTSRGKKEGRLGERGWSESGHPEVYHRAKGNALVTAVPSLFCEKASIVFGEPKNSEGKTAKGGNPKKGEEVHPAGE